MIARGKAFECYNRSRTHSNVPIFESFTAFSVSHSLSLSLSLSAPLIHGFWSEVFNVKPLCASEEEEEEGKKVLPFAERQMDRAGASSSPLHFSDFGMIRVKEREGGRERRGRTIWKSLSVVSRERGKDEIYSPSSCSIEPPSSFLPIKNAVPRRKEGRGRLKGSA